MARHPLFKNFKRITAELLNSNETQPKQEESRFNRREFLAGSLALAASAGPVQAIKKLGPMFSSQGAGASTIIVGAGIAGLVTAHRLAKRGVRPTLFEANQRLGGRIFTQQKFNDEGMFCELGGELIDSTQSSILGLCHELNVPLEDFTESDKGLSKLYFAQGKIRSESELQEAAKPLLKIMLEDLNLLYNRGSFEVPTYQTQLSPQVRVLDQMSLVEYLQSKKDRVETWLLDLIQEAYESEFGMTASKQSALNLLVLFDNDPNQSFKMYGASDESKRVIGGNSNLIKALEKKVQSKARLEMGHTLMKVVDKGSAFELTFSTPGKTQVVKAERVILALPFSVLRDVEGIQNLNLTPAKKKSIAELGYGTDSKLMMGFKERFWRKQNGDIPASCGTVFGDFPTQCFWETSRLQKGTKGILTALFGGQRGINPPTNIVEASLNDLEKIYPKASSLLDGNKALMKWPQIPSAKGSYSTPSVGQYSTLMGAAGEPELGGRLLFAGEHCSVRKQGYMDGAVESGNQAAELYFKTKVRSLSGKNPTAKANPNLGF